MRYAERTSAHTGECRGQAGATECAIFEVLLSRDMRPGDSIDIILAQHQTERMGIGSIEFSVGVVQLLDDGLLAMRDTLFYLTEAGFAALKRMRTRLPVEKQRPSAEPSRAAA